jgi:dihydropteroate synthase
MAIVNITGDSFSEGSASAPESAVRRALALFEEGADILDLGAESTRPGSAPDTPAEECARLLPVLQEIREHLPEVPISVDTRHGETAALALKYGADIINDVSAGRDVKLLEAAGAAQAGLVLCHSRSTPAHMQEFTLYPGGVRNDVEKELRESCLQALKSGVKKENIWLDPGIGFAKTAEQCRTLIDEAPLFSREYPWLWGISRKSFMGGSVDSRAEMTLKLELQLVAGGASVIRTHDIRSLRRALAMKGVA